MTPYHLLEGLIELRETVYLLNYQFIIQGTIQK